MYRSLHSHSHAGTLSGESRAANRLTDLGTDRAWERDCQKVKTEACLSAFRRYISPLRPLLRPDELTLSNILMLLDGNQPAQQALALAVWALGQWCLIAGAGPYTAALELHVMETDARCGKAAGLLNRYCFPGPDKKNVFSGRHFRR